MMKQSAIYQCRVCGNERVVNARVALSQKSIFCCGVMMVKKRQGVIRKNGR